MKQLLEKRGIQAIGVVGAGRMGPEIALFLAQSLGRFGVGVTVVDPDCEALRRARERLEKKLQQEVESGTLKAEAAATFLGALGFTPELGELAGAGLVVEAIPEEGAAKGELFARLEGVCPAGAILASSSAHREPGELFSRLGDKRRALVLNFHHPLDRNLLVEVVPHAETEPALVDDLLRLLELLGRVPLPVKSRYGHALGPIVAGLVQAAAQIVESGQATVKQVDAVARKALRLGTGPLAALNQPGAAPTVLQGLREMRQRLGPWFAIPAILEKKVQAGEPWEAAAREEKVEVPPELFQVVAGRLQGAYFGLVTEVLDDGLLPLADLELAVETALGGAPFARMNELGLAESLARVREFAAASLGFAVPAVLERQAESGEPWEIPVVVRRDIDGVAVVTIRRPRVLNALNAEVIRQLGETFLVVGEDPAVRAAVLTGFGTRAFVAGADIGELAALPGEAEAEDLSLTGQEVLEIIENLGKPVVCAMNGLAFGGGNELAMACHARLAPRGTRVLAGQPEPKLGLIPGYGGTQRLPRWVGMEKAWPLLRTGDPISSAQARELGLIRDEVEWDLLEAAIDLSRKAAAGEAELPPIPRSRIKVPKTLPEVDLGHLSRKIDEILQEAVLGGAKRSLEEGLELESRLFGRCFTTRDGRIGLENFLKNGPRAKAEFVNE